MYTPDEQRVDALFARFPALLHVVRQLNEHHIPWLLGGSGSLYLYGNERFPDDVDLYLPDASHDAADALFGIESYIYSSEQENVRNSNPGDSHDIQLTSHLTLSLAGKDYRFDFGEASYSRERCTAKFQGQEFFILPPEDVLLIKALLRRGEDVGKHDIADIETFMKICPINQDYLSKRISRLGAEERIADTFNGTSMKISPEQIDRFAHLIWNYHHMGYAPKKADCILALGSHDTRVAVRAAELYLDGHAPILIFSGGLGNLTSGKWDRPEAQIFADIAAHMGVPTEAMLIEDRSTNTGENIQFTERLLAEKGLSPASYLVVQKPYMERRAYATFKVWLPDKEVMVTSPQLSFEEYPNNEISRDDVINIMVGDLQRLREYPAKGFMIAQDIPDEVWSAYEELVKAGFTRHLLPGGNVL